MKEYIEVLFRTDRTGFIVNRNNIKIEPDMDIVVKVERGEDIARVINCAVLDSVPEERMATTECEKVLRTATKEDYVQLEAVIRKEEEARNNFLEILERYPFEMKLLDTVYQLDGNKLTFFFSADGRIDFREFVRELASEFRTRIELHQSSGREDARRYGGYGMCGKSYCCVSWLKKFNQVTIKMAKDQNLLNNLSKISGPCGRLLCCLHYEEDVYLQKSSKFPQINEHVFVNDTKMFVLKNDYYNDKVHLISEDDVQSIITLEEFNKLKKR